MADYFPKSNIVRVMPNLGAVVGCSNNLTCGAGIDNEIYNMIFLLDKNFIVNDEKLLIFYQTLINILQETKLTCL